MHETTANKVEKNRLRVQTVANSPQTPEIAESEED
jgi:hypothetical protein